MRRNAKIGLHKTTTNSSETCSLNLKLEEDSTECGQRIAPELQRTIDGWYLLQIFTSIPFTNYSLYVS
jgi:hypothetical protein